MCVFLCSVFLIMFVVMGTITTPSVTVVCSRLSTTITAVTMAPTTLGLAAVGRHDVAPPPQLILRDTIGGSVGFATVPQQYQPESHMPS